MDLLYKTLLDLSSECFVIHENGIAVDVNMAFIQLLGYKTKDEVIGTDFIKAHFSNENQEFVKKQLNVENAFYEVDGFTLGNKKIPLRINSRLVSCDSGDLRIAIIKNISAEKRSIKAKEAAEVSKNQLMFILDASPVGIAFSTNGIIQFANQKLKSDFGIEVGDFMPNFYVNPKEWDKVLVKLKKESKGLNYEVKMYDKNRQVCDFIISYEPFNYYGKEGILVWLIDITERKEVERSLIKAKELAEEKETILKGTKDELVSLNEELTATNEELFLQKEKLVKTQKQLIRSEKMASIGILSAGIAHEINNPVNFISSGMTGLKKNYKRVVKNLNLYRNLNSTDWLRYQEINNMLDSDINQALEFSNKMFQSIQEGINRTVEIINSMRVFSSNSETEFSKININEIIDAVLNLLNNTYKNKINIIKNFTSDSTIEGISGELHQVFMNILANAIDAIPEKGTIYITTKWSKNNKVVIISIKDSGIGIPQEISHRIFDPFFSTKEVGKGMGLGLYLSYNIINHHNGSVNFISNNKKGTEFLIALPKSNKV